jgi:hypothetical protein
MKNYQITKTLFGEIIFYEQGGQKFSIPTDPNNSDYAEYLRYNEWVEAGNKPEDFWKQNELGEIAEGE